MLKENRSLKETNFAWFLLEKLEKITEKNIKLSSELSVKSLGGSFDNVDVAQKQHEINELQIKLTILEMDQQKQISIVAAKFNEEIAKLETELRRTKENLEEALKHDRLKNKNWRECPYCAEKQKEIVEKSSKIAEIQDLLNKSVKIDGKYEELREQYFCLKERITCKLALIERSLTEPKKVINLESKSIKSLIDNQNRLESWWVKVPELVKDHD